MKKNDNNPKTKWPTDETIERIITELKTKDEKTKIFGESPKVMIQAINNRTGWGRDAVWSYIVYFFSIWDWDHMENSY